MREEWMMVYVCFRMGQPNRGVEEEAIAYALKDG